VSGFGPVALLGGGRLGCSLRLALEAAAVPIAVHWTRSPTTAEAARAEGFDVVSGPLPESIRDAAVLFLAVSDRALAPMAEELCRSGLVAREATVLHGSGASDLSVLAPLASSAHVASLHPLVSVASRRTPLSGAACAIEGADDETNHRVESLARTMGLVPLRFRGDRTRYHAAACIVGNFPQALMAAAVRLFEDAGIEASSAREALGPLLTSAARNAVERDGAAAFSGPIIRGDVEVVARHLEVLAAPSLVDIERLYRANSLVAVHTVDGPQRTAFEALLEGGR
jgi:predicted short-subunit dehydrogenase-like oxidoreductase (DUF2520 family)